MTTSALDLGRDAVRRHAWSEAVEAFRAAEEAESLSPQDLEAEAEAAWWNADAEGAIRALERAFAEYDGAGHTLDAARVAQELAYVNFRRLAVPVAGGWLARAERLLLTAPESAAHARQEMFGALRAMLETRLDEGLERADRAIGLAQTHGDLAVQYESMSLKGLGLIAKGDWQAGLAIIDEAAAAAMSGQLNLSAASDIYCQTIAACRNIGDYPRARQWTDEAERWMRRQTVGGYPGVCQVHRAELKMLNGAWPEAEQEARRACEELERFSLLLDAGWGRYELGEVRRRMGDLEAAAEAFDRAYEYGHDAQPGLALLQLAHGDVDEAARSIGRALAARAGPTLRTPDRPGRAELLPAQVEIALARGDLETARAAAGELEDIARQFPLPAFEAAAETARGATFLAEGQAAEASAVLARAWRRWQEMQLPYESARTRVLLAEALEAEGDHETAVRDLQAAHATFVRLGAARDVQRVEALLGGGGIPTRAESRQTAKRTFMFTDIVTSTELLEAIGDEAWAELLDWHDRELRSSIARNHGEEVVHTGDGFFAAFERGGDAVESAVDIQRRLAQHRREHGFAPRVRIGLHAANASRKGGNYTGQGVHVAARMAAAADGEQILVSRAALDEAGTIAYPVSESRPVALKGVAKPIEVRTVDWR